MGVWSSGYVHARTTCSNGDVHAYTCLGMENVLDSTGDLGGAVVIFRDSSKGFGAMHVHVHFEVLTSRAGGVVH